ncbi:NUDIX domain-containing protein [Metallococcus carri]|uniref:NUDIX domain-containing protein n=1 Tax=Metallococcus carri TaxID=1656884 RepID=UPI001581E786|nr:NUDIX domain-containing protein [Metallococcus carri]
MRIRVKSMAILPNPEFTAHAVAVHPPTPESPHGYHRLIGGSVEPGETHRAAIAREIREELGAELTDEHLLGVVESIFTIRGAPGHEIVFLYAGRLTPPIPPQGTTLTEDDGAQHPVVWRSLNDADEQLPLYPADAARFVHRLPRTDQDRQAEREATVAAYDLDAEAYASGTGAIPEDLLAELDRFAGLVGTGGSVLEIGSGPGRDAALLEARGLAVDRTDITPAFVDRMRAAGHNARVLDPLRDDLGGPYDGAWCDAVLLHLSRPEMAIVLHKLHQAIRPGGHLYAGVKEGDGDGWTRHGNVAGARHFTYWTEPALREVLTAAGWRVDEVHRAPGRRLQETWLNVFCSR